MCFPSPSSLSSFLLSPPPRAQLPSIHPPHPAIALDPISLLHLISSGQWILVCGRAERGQRRVRAHALAQVGELPTKMTAMWSCYPWHAWRHNQSTPLLANTADKARAQNAARCDWSTEKSLVHAFPQSHHFHQSARHGRFRGRPLSMTRPELACLPYVCVPHGRPGAPELPLVHICPAIQACSPLAKEENCRLRGRWSPQSQWRAPQSFPACMDADVIGHGVTPCHHEVVP